MASAKSIIVWGDSILKGIVSSEDLKEIRPAEENALKLACDELGIELINKSIYGAPITKIQQTQKKNLAKNLTADICLIESATNDSDYEWTQVAGAGGDLSAGVAGGEVSVGGAPINGEIKPKVPFEDFKRIVNEVVLSARDAGITPVLVTSTPLVTDWWFDYICIGLDRKKILDFIGGDIERLGRNQQKYSDYIKEYAESNKIQLIDLRAEFIKAPDTRALMCKDGVHPNLDGHKFMAEIFKREIPRLEIRR